MIVDFQPPEVWEVTISCLSHPAPWYFVKAARTDEDRDCSMMILLESAGGKDASTQMGVDEPIQGEQESESVCNPMLRRGGQSVEEVQ